MSVTWFEPPGMKEIDLLREKFFAQLHGKPQQIKLADLACRELTSGVQLLRSLGCQVWVTEIEPPAAEQWPRLFFHPTAAPNGRMVLCEADWRELGPGWHTTALAAALADGMETQFAGRGGVARKGALVLVSDEDSKFYELPEVVKHRLIEQFKRERDQTNDNG